MPTKAASVIPTSIGVSPELSLPLMALQSIQEDISRLTSIRTASNTHSCVSSVISAGPSVARAASEGVREACAALATT